MHVTFRIYAFLTFLLAAGSASAQTYIYGTWAHNRDILFNTTATGANVTGPTNDFPVHIHLDANNFIFGEAGSTGEDIRFEDPDGTPLYYEIESWEPGIQVADIWVKVPQITGNSEADFIRMFWGKAGQTSQSNGPGTFTPVFQGVWHLNEAGNNTPSNYKDASANLLHGTGANLTTGSSVPGYKAKGTLFDGITQYIDVGGINLLHPSPALTLEAWVKFNSKTANTVFLSKPFFNSSAPHDEYALGLDAVGDKFRFSLTLGSTNYTLLSAVSPSTSVWYYVVATFDGTNMRLYVNGVEDGSAAHSGTVASHAQSLRLGSYGWNTDFFSGVLDEVRFSNTVRQAPWIKLAYANGDFHKMAPRVWDGGGGDNFWSNPANWSGNNVPSPVEDVLFDGSFDDNVILDNNIEVKSLILHSDYNGTFSFNSYSLTILKGPADFRSGNLIIPGPGSSLIFAPPTAVTLNFHPKLGATFPAIIKNGPGVTNLIGNLISDGNLSINAGTLNLGTAQTVTVNGNLSVAGGSLAAANASLDVDGNFTMSSGSFQMPSGFLYLAGNFSYTGGTLLHNSGTLVLYGTATGRTLYINPALTLNNLTVNGTGGALAVTNNGLTLAGTLTLAAGTLDISTNNVAMTAGAYVQSGGTLTATLGNLDVNGDFTQTGGLLTAPDAGHSLSVAGSFTQTGGTFSPGLGTVYLDGTGTGKAFNCATGLNHVAFTGSRTWTVGGNPLNTNSLTLNNATLNLGSAPLIHQVSGTTSFSSGILNFGSSTLVVQGSTLDLSSLTSVVDVSGTLEFVSSGNQTFTPNPAATHPKVKLSGSGQVLIDTYNLNCSNVDVNNGTLNLGARSLNVSGNLSVVNGTLNLGSSAHSVGSIATSGGTGTLNFGSSTVTVTTGSAVFSGLSSLDAGTGTLAFTANSGTQYLEAKTTTDHPNIAHTGAGTLQLMNNDLSCLSFLQSNGILHFNNKNLTTASAGNFTINNGTPTSIDGLSGSTLEVWGNAAFNGTSSTNRLNLNPTGTWNLNVHGIATAELATVKNADARSGDTVSCFNCDDAGSNLAWTFAVTWDGGGTDATCGGGALDGNKWSCAANWGTDAVPGATDNVTFNSGTKGVILDASVTVKNFTMTSGYYGSLDFGNSTLSITGNADFRSFGGIIANTGTLQFTATSGTQVFTPKASYSHPNITHTGAGTLQLANNDLLTLGFSQSAGTLDFNGKNISTTSSGDFTVENGSSTSFLNLGGTTLTVQGDASLAGLTSANRLNLNPGSTWTLNVTGILSASFASMNFSNAGGSPGTCTNCSNQGNNILWSFFDTVNPDNVANFTATATGANSVALAWTASPSGDAHEVMLRYRTDGTYPTSSTDGTLWGSVAVPLSSETVTGLSEKTVYHFAAFVKDSAGNFSSSAPTAQDTARTPDVTAPDNVPTFTATASGANSVSLTWTASPSGDAESVLLRYRTDGTYPTNSTDGTLWSTVSAALSSETVTGLSEKTVYHFAAFVKDSAGNYSSAMPTAQDTARTWDVTAPANVPSFTATASGANSVGLTWAATSGDAESVLLLYRTDGTYPTNSTDGTLWSTVSAALSSETVTGLSEKTVYHFAAFVKDSSGNYSLAAAGAQDTARTPDVTPPANVTVFTATASGANSVALAWTASTSSDADSVRLRYRTDGSFPTDTGDGILWRTVSAALTSETVTVLSEKTVYHFAAFVKDSSGNYSLAAAGAQDSARTLDVTLPASVTVFTATASGGNSVALAWIASGSSDADSVRLRYRTDGTYPTSSTDGTLWRTVSASLTSETATGLSDKTVYHFAAFVKDSSGNYSLAVAGAQDSARTPDVTPPANVTAFTASAITASSTALTWTPSAGPDADTVMIRYATGMVPPVDTGAGTLWKKKSASANKDTVTGLATNAIYAFSLFVRDSSGNYSPGTAAASDTSLIQAPVLGSLVISDASGYTRDSDPALAFTWSGADSLRFSLLADTATAVWRTVISLDSLNMGADGKKIVAAQFKNTFGNRSAWMRDTTILDRQAPALTLDLNATHGRWTWPVAVSGKSKDSLSGNDRIFVIRRRVSDGFHFNGAIWTASPDTAKLILSGADSLFAASMPVASMSTGDYEFIAYGQDRLGNIGAPLTRSVHYEDNRVPALAFGNLPDTLLQNQAGSWKLDFGDLDTTDSLSEVSFDAPAWLTAAPGPDTSFSPWAVHRTYALAGKPLQAHVGANSIQVRIQDKGGLILTYSKTLWVADVNDAPVFADSQSTYTVKEDSASAWQPRFADVDVQDTHTMALLAAPSFARLDGLELSFKPGSRDVGNHLVRLLVSDGQLTDTLETTLTVANVNDPPYAFPSTGWKSPAFFREDQADTFSVVVVDMDRNESVALATALPAYVKVTSTIDSTGFNRTFRFVVKPGQTDTGSVSASLTFVDAGNSSSQLAWTARVLPDNDTPTAAIEEVRTHAGAARIRLSVADEDGSLEKARFHYRLVGASGDTLRRGITSSSVLALHPLANGDYRLAVLAEDQDGLKQPAYAVHDFTISGATALSLDTARWHMIGVPHASLPASDLGAGATLASWDEVGDDGQPMARYSSGKTVESLKRGKGYWVRLTQSVNLKAEQKDLLEGPYSMKLTHSKQGWNQIANPYPYWVDVSASRLTFWEWDADKRDLVNARGLLKPWAAYWVLAPRDTVLRLPDAPYFPASQAPLAKAASIGMTASFRNRGEWSVQLALRAGAYHDRANAMGVGPASAMGNPLADAPKFGDYVALHFEKGVTGDAAQGFAADYHAALDPAEEWWDFSVENSGTGESRALLTPAGLEPLAAAGLRVFLVRQGEARPVEPGETVALAMEGAKTHYSLVVTPHADFASRLKGTFSVSQNFPNPVTTFTAFRFVLPQSWDKEGRRMTRDFNLRINLYDYSGRQVAKVASGTYRPGVHTLLWKPVSGAGGALAKGSYIYRLETPGFVKSMKMVLE